MSQVKIERSPQALKVLLTTASAKAVVLFAGDVIAYRVGTLSENAYRALGSALMHYWPVSPQHNINRYVGLFLDDQFYLLYARYLPQGDHLLGLVFPLRTPLIRMRQDMTEIMRAILPYVISESATADPLEQTLQLLLKSYPQPDPQYPTRVSHAGWRLEVDEEPKHIEDESVQQEPNIQSGTITNNEMLQNTRSLSYGPKMDRDVMEDIPWQPIGDEWPLVPEKSQDKLVPSETSALKKSSPGKKEVSPKRKDAAWQPLKEHPHTEDDLVSILQEDFDLKEDLSELADWMLPGNDALQKEPESDVFDAASEESSPRTLINQSRGNADKDGTMGVNISDLCFYLVPRGEAHPLLETLSQKMMDWLVEICETYGWQLDDISVHSKYLKWRLDDFPESLIQPMVRIVRRETSERIFRNFLDGGPDNSSEDFWSPGYLVDRQNRDLSFQEIVSGFKKGQ